MKPIIRTLLLGGLMMLALSGITAASALASGAPFVETKPASSVGETIATLNGVVNPNGAETKYKFEYGPTAAYGTNTAELSAGAGTTNLEKNAVVSGLTKSTGYHFRIVATNANGTSLGADQQFSTTSETICHKDKKAGTKKWVLCKEGQPVGSPTENKSAKLVFHIKTGTVAHLTWPATIGLVFTCTSATGVGTWQSQMDSGEIAGMHFALTGCTSTYQDCKLPEASFGGTSDPGEIAGHFGPGIENLDLTPKLGTFANLTISGGECIWTGKKTVKGHVECTFQNAEVESAEHQIKCEEAKSHLNDSPTEIKLGIEETMEVAHPLEGPKFSIIEST